MRAQKDGEPATVCEGVRKVHGILIGTASIPAMRRQHGTAQPGSVEEILEDRPDPTPWEQQLAAFRRAATKTPNNPAPWHAAIPTA
jgi:hypothetical protein